MRHCTSSFEGFLLAMDHKAPKQWALRDKSIQYSELQDRLEACSEEHDAHTALHSQLKQLDGQGLCKFAELLLKEATRLRRLLYEEAKHITSCCRLEHSTSGTPSQIESGLHWFSEFGAINTIALRRLVEQHTRCCWCQTGPQEIEDFSSLHRSLAQEIQRVHVDSLRQGHMSPILEDSLGHPAGERHGAYKRSTHLDSAVVA